MPTPMIHTSAVAAIHKLLARLLFGAASIALLASCGGGGGNPGVCTGGPATCAVASSSASASYSSVDFSPLASAESAANVCTLEGQKRFSRYLLNDYYLWYDEVRSVDARNYSSASAYFYSLLTETPDANNLPKDRFSFVVSTTDAESLVTGVNVGYGVTWKEDSAKKIRVAFVEPNSPAAAAGMARGGQLESITSGETARVWYPNTANASVSFTYRDTPASALRSITLNAVTVVEDVVPIVKTVTSPLGRKVGYIDFHGFSAGAQDKLIEAVTTLKSAAVQDLVLDLRYNGGGYVFIAQSLASMIAGASSDGKTLEQLRFNNKRSDETSASVYKFINSVAFADQVAAPKYAKGTALPRLNLSKVYILSSGDSCSASEAVINGLRGIDVDVVLVGSSTCGKPYGFSEIDNCGLAYFAIEFDGVNAKGVGGYTAGFAARCPASDDFEHKLGDVAERKLSIALQHADSGICATASARDSIAQSKPLVSKWDAQTFAKPMSPGRVLLPR
jgi:carboxyl-terminal processing protease